jgi:hypothetical protein
LSVIVSILFMILSSTYIRMGTKFIEVYVQHMNSIRTPRLSVGFLTLTVMRQQSRLRFHFILHLHHQACTTSAVDQCFAWHKYFFVPVFFFFLKNPPYTVNQLTFHWLLID